MLLFLRPNAIANTLPENFSVAGMQLDGMTRSEAASLLESAVRQDMTLTLPVGEITIAPDAISLGLDADGLLQNAAQSGDTEPGLAPWLRLDESALRSILTTSLGELEAAYTPASFALSREVAMDEVSFDPGIPAPDLLITLGTSGIGADLDALTARIREAYSGLEFQVDLRSMLTAKNPEAPDMDAIALQIICEAKDASIHPETGEIIPASYGIHFDKKEATMLVRRAAPGETVRIPTEYDAPRRLAVDMEFPDVLGFCQTPHTNNEERNANLQLACASLNGVVLQPGETLSYNATLGQRTLEAGYKKAPAYSGTELVDSLGGGICQVSSTLYLCSLYAELEIVERISHGYPSTYMPIGLDATVSWGKPDLKIRNNYDTPIKIVAEPQDGLVCVWLMGKETRDYYVRIGFSSNGNYASATYRRYDRQTNEMIEKITAPRSSYLENVASTTGEIGPEEIYRYGLCRQQGLPEPTAETLAASRRNIGPNTMAP